MNITLFELELTAAKAKDIYLNFREHTAKAQGRRYYNWDLEGKEYYYINQKHAQLEQEWYQAVVNLKNMHKKEQ